MSIPSEYLERFEQSALKMKFGTVSLILHVKQGKRRYEVGYVESFIPNEEQSTHDNSSGNEEIGAHD